MNWIATAATASAAAPTLRDPRLPHPISEANWSTSQLVATKAALPSGSPEAHVIPQLPPNGRYLAVRAIDKAGNAGPIVMVIRPA